MKTAYDPGSRVDAGDVTAHWEVRSPKFASVHTRLQVIGGLIAELPERPRTALDVGCGPARMRDALPPGVEYFGVDIAPTVIAAHADPEHFALADINAGAVPFEGRTFDVVICSGIFEYVHDPAAFIDLVVDRTRVGGHVVLTYMNRWHYRECSWRLRGLPLHYPDPHVNFISIPDAARLLHARCRPVARRALTAGGRVAPAPLAFPLGILNRQYIFVARRAR